MSDIAIKAPSTAAMKRAATTLRKMAAVVKEGGLIMPAKDSGDGGLLRLAEAIERVSEERDGWEAEARKRMRRINDIALEKVQLEERLRVAESTLERIPKCWRLNESGELVQDCPVLPCIELWSFTSDGSHGMSWASLQESDEPVVEGDQNGFAPQDFSDFYNSREALEAAGQGVKR